MTQAVFLAGARFHHVGYACTDIDSEAAVFATLGYAVQGAVFADEAQGIRGLFMTGGGPCIELLENLPGRTTLTPWLEAGIRMYHLAYEVADIDATLAGAPALRGRIVVPPTPATAFGGRRISFVMFRHGPLIELIDTPALSSTPAS